MTFLQIAVAYAAYVVIGVIVCLAALTAWIELHGSDPLRLLDGRRLGAVLDDRDRARHIAQASDEYRAAERLSMELDYVYSLPAREHPGWGL